MDHIVVIGSLWDPLEKEGSKIQLIRISKDEIKDKILGEYPSLLKIHQSQTKEDFKFEDRDMIDRLYPGLYDLEKMKCSVYGVVPYNISVVDNVKYILKNGYIIYTRE